VTPARLAEIRAYIRRLDLDQLPPWTVEQTIIRDLFEDSWPHYTSTYCIHGLHGHCRQECKICESACLCDCHTGPP
jgi:hypothetical protein